MMMRLGNVRGAMLARAGSHHDAGAAASGNVNVGDFSESVEGAACGVETVVATKAASEDTAAAFFERIDIYGQAVELDLDRISKMAAEHCVRVCVYGCSLLEKVKKGDCSKQRVAKKDDDSKHVYQKVLYAMRSDDMAIVGHPQSKVLYCICSRKDGGKGVSLYRLHDLEDELFGLHESKTAVGVAVGGREAEATASGSSRMTCSLCAWAYPIQDTDHFERRQKHLHLNTVSHKRAVTCAVLFHALKSFGAPLHHFRFKISKKNEAGKDKPIEAASLSPEKFKFAFSDIIFWYLHHDSVPHVCEGERIVVEVLKLYRETTAPPQIIISDVRVLISICAEFDFSHQTSQALARRSAWKNKVAIVGWWFWFRR